MNGRTHITNEDRHTVDSDRFTGKLNGKDKDLMNERTHLTSENRHTAKSDIGHEENTKTKISS